ncbi:MAG: hypothetical protein HDS86_01250, partial [Bacteroidales bacterium]|nr:hypothetical protein [Bacteroidales bacterium]
MKSVALRCVSLLLFVMMNSVMVFAQNNIVANAVKLGNARLSVMLHILSDTKEESSIDTFDVDGFLKETDIYVGTISLFDRWDNEHRTLMERDGAVYHAEVPVDRIEEICGIRVFRNGEFVGGTQVMVNQNKVAGVRIFMSKDGNILSLSYLDGATSEEWMNATGVIQWAHTVDPSFFVPKDKSMYESWESMRDYE